MKDDRFNHLPKKVKLSLYGDKEKEEDIKEIEKLTDEEKDLINRNKNYIESKLWLWEKDKDFEFILPPTIFTEKKIITNEDNLRYNDERIQYENEGIVGQHFSQEILDQIWQKGEFIINSKDPELTYTWKL